MDSWVGQTLGKVHIDALLARGGMAEVYIGTHTTLQREVAVKVLRNNYDDHPHALERFQREAMVVGKLRHPNIVQVFDFDLVDSHPYLVMEYIKGPSLLKYLNSLHEKDKKLDFPAIVRFMDAMTSALQYAHDSGVIHRDIKPGNILLASRTSDIILGKPLPDDFEPVLTDFGLVRFIDSTQHTTGSGAIAGTPAYMSPEQARGDLTDGRTDVYSLGIVLYEILAGHLPFEGETTMGVLMKHINEPPAPVPGLPPAMQNVLDRALAKDVEDRFQTPAEFGEAFNMAIEGKADFATLDVLHPRPTRKASKRIFKEKKKRPAWIIPVISALIIMAVAAGFMFSGVFQLPFGADSTSTSTETDSASSIPVPSDAVGATQTPVPAVLLGRTGVLAFKDASAVADQAVLSAAALLSPPSGSQYEVWLVDGKNRLSLGILTLDGSGRGELTFTDEQKLNLVGTYSGVEVTIEPDPDPDPKSSGIVAYSFSQAPDGLEHLRFLLTTYPSAPNQIALIQGLYSDVQTINELAVEMQKASTNENTDRVRLNAEAILNLLVGSQSPDYKDWNADGQVDDPSDGFGLLLNGQNLGYLQAVYTEVDAAIKAPGASQQMVTSGEAVESSIQDLAQWTDQLKTDLVKILTTTSRADLNQGVTDATVLAAKMLNGVDVDEDGVVESIVGEGGALAAFEQAYQMADMPLQAVGIMNLGTGTPTFILVAPSSTHSGSGGSSGGGSGGSSSGSTQQAPPGQQKTSKPPPGQQKTKKPTGNNTGTSSNSTTGNTTTNNGNNGGGNGNGNGNGN
jgi:serine/threonine protein kinase